MPDYDQLQALSRATRDRILTMSTKAGSGHPTSSLSATDLMVTLLFGGTFRYDIKNPQYPTNDRLLFSKGHASPLFYALWAAAGAIKDEGLLTYRQLGSALEGHPRPNFPYAEAATGSLGQGLGIGAGMAYAAKLDTQPYRTFVLLGDSELAEGSNWETMELAGRWRLGNLIGIVDLNALGQRGETLHGHDAAAIAKRVEAFGWRTIVIEGHDHDMIQEALETATDGTHRPTMIIAKTEKGRGVAFWEGQEGWHGKPLPEAELEKARAGLGSVDLSARGTITPPPAAKSASKSQRTAKFPRYTSGDSVASRTAFGEALAAVGTEHDEIVVLDADVGNSTMTETFMETAPERYIECYIAEQHMTAMAVGLARRGKRPVAATFAAFLSRAHDQIRMAAYSDVDMLIVGSHAGVSIGPDGPSQMGLEDIAQFRDLPGSTVLYPSDATSAAALTRLALNQSGISYLRTTRGKTPVLYGPDESFEIGRSKALRSSDTDVATIVAAGITVPEALAAADALAADDVHVRVLDLYSIKPIDTEALCQASRETGRLIVVEDHYQAGGIGEAVRSALDDEPVRVDTLCVTEIVGSGTPEELLGAAGIDKTAIMKAVQQQT